jgi:transposase
LKVRPWRRRKDGVVACCALLLDSIATRYDKLGATFFAFIQLAAIRIFPAIN